jgi:DNA-binding transcriptional ArsR family regulator
VSTNGAAVLDALGDRTRRAIVERLADHPAAVGELAAHLPVTRPAVSQHLKVLKDAGLVFAERAGTRRIYRIDPTGADALRAYLDRFWGDALRSFQTVVEAHPETLQEQP